MLRSFVRIPRPRVSPPVSHRMASTFPDIPIFRAIASHDPESTAIVHSKSNRSFTYGQLLRDVESAKVRLHGQIQRAVEYQARKSEQHKVGDVQVAGQRVAFLVENSYDYVVTLLSIFACDSIAVPLSSSFPFNELRYILDNSEASTLLASSTFLAQAQGLRGGRSLYKVEKIGEERIKDEVTLVPLPVTKGGLMLYTSGTTSRPKGVVLHTSALTAQAESLKRAWKYSPKDHLLHVLPLHHIHGCVNALLTPLFCGSTIEFQFPFNVDDVWERFACPFVATPSTSTSTSASTSTTASTSATPSASTASTSATPSASSASTASTSTTISTPTPTNPPITFFTVVPTIYNRLISTYDALPSHMKTALKKALSPETLRLNISGSAALPTPTKNAWTEITGNVLLERYGMTEVGMALSCGLDFKDRVDGSVGWPLPGVDARLVDEQGNIVDEEGISGEIQLRGPGILQEYWRNEKATKEEFDEEWFKTGDIAVRRSVPSAGQSGSDWAKGPMYFIQGRKSTDIIKTGGEKVSALEVERELLSLPSIVEAAVIGRTSEKWGQIVSAIVVLHPDCKKFTLMDMRRALKDTLVKYKIPQELKVVDQIPKNAMGKVNKKLL